MAARLIFHEYPPEKTTLVSCRSPQEILKDEIKRECQESCHCDEPQEPYGSLSGLDTDSHGTGRSVIGCSGNELRILIQTLISN
jgi:hypothetical protein